MICVHYVPLFLFPDCLQRELPSLEFELGIWTRAKISISSSAFDRFRFRISLTVLKTLVVTLERTSNESDQAD